MKHSECKNEFDENEGLWLFPRIRHDAICTLNEAQADMGRNIVKSWDERFDTTRILESDVDAQLIVYIPFMGSVKLKSIVLRCMPDTTSPQICQIFMNRDDIDFDSVELLTPVQSLNLVTPHDAGKIIEYPVKTQFYGSCTNITLFFTHNWSQNDLSTRICLLGFKGIWSELPRNPVITVYESAPNPLDHTQFIDHPITLK
ncbi:hypothetical protein PCK1_000652 [Pneumocystis canis]|nr:hypothetical protein PCK1_000652 [Pneumocystis canis]